MSNTKRRMENTDPVENIERAWKIAVNPRDYSKSERSLLLKRGLEHYVTDGAINQTRLLQDTSQFVLNALRRERQKNIISDPPEIINYPGKMALFFSIGSLLVRRHELIVNDPRNARVHKHIRRYYLNLIYAAAEHSEHRGVILTTTGELVYSRDQEDEYGPPIGRPVEDITTIDNTNELYFKIPLTHATRKCEARIGDDLNGDMQCIIDGPYVYIPLSDVYDKYEEYFTGYNGVASILENAVENTVSEDRLKSWQTSITGVNDRIERISETGHENILFEERRYPAKLEAILRSIEAVDEDIAKLGEKLTADEICNAVRDYATWTETEWVKKECEKISSASSVAKSLSSYAKNDDLQHVEVEKRDGKPNLYTLEYMVGNFKQIEVTEIGDLIELPCMESLHQSLLQKKPLRWELYSFVRYIMEVNNAEFTIEDIHEWFSQYDWYRKDVTEYQVNYEQEQRMKGGDRPLPISCNNDNRNWAEHCIGKENCDYSLYRSVELKPDVYSRAGSN